MPQCPGNCGLNSLLRREGEKVSAHFSEWLGCTAHRYTVITSEDLLCIQRHMVLDTVVTKSTFSPDFDENVTFNKEHPSYCFQMLSGANDQKSKSGGQKTSQSL